MENRFPDMVRGKRPRHDPILMSVGLKYARLSSITMTSVGIQTKLIRQTQQLSQDTSSTFFFR